MPGRARGLIVGVIATVGLNVLGSVSPAAAAPAQQVSTDTYTNAVAQHQTQVDLDSYAWGSTEVSVFQTGRFNIDGGATNTGWATTTNGGATWSYGFMPGITTAASPPGPYPRAVDPSVTYDALHGVWLAATLGVAQQPNGSYAETALEINRSADGLTWSAPVHAVASNHPDKSWVACDNWATSPYYGRCYAAFSEQDFGLRLGVATSSDGGVSWSTPRYTASNATGYDVNPVVRPDGTVVVVHDDGVGTVQAFRSTDGGATWTAPVTVSGASARPRHTVSSVRALSKPSAAVDDGGKIYVGWHDCSFRPSCASNDIVFSTSVDGVTWSASRRVSVDPVTSTVDHFIAGFGVRPGTAGATAELGAAYYWYPVAACGATGQPTCQLNAGFTSSTDGGATWSPVTTLNATPMSPFWLPLTNRGPMTSDYLSVDYPAGKATTVVAIAPKGPSGSTFFSNAHAATMTPAGPQPTLSVNDVSVTEGNAGTTSATFTVSLSAASASPVTVTVATANGTATAGSDFTATSVVATIPAGQLSTTVAVPVSGDTTVEPDETFSVNLSSPSGATIARGTGTGTIVNDDAAPLPTLSVNDVSVTEGNAGTTSATFTVTLSAASASPVTVTVATANGTATAGSDYTATSVVATIPAGQLSTTVAVPVSGDTTVEPDETFSVTLSGPSGATIARGTGTATIVNDDAAPLPTLSVNDVSVTEGNAGTTPATFTVSLSAASAAPVTVTVATANGTATAGTDYTATSVVATIAAGQLSTTVAVPVSGDTTVEPDETFSVNLSSPSGATIADGTGVATIVNDDAPPLPSLSVDDIAVPEGNAGTTSATFTVSLSAASASPVTVTVATADGAATAGSDYTATSVLATIPAGQLSTTVAVQVSGDTTVEPDETFSVNLSGPTGATIADGTGVATIVNDDTASLSVDDVSVTEGNAGTTSATFTLSLSAASVSPVSVTVATANGTATAGADYTATSVVATIPAGQLSTTVAVQVSGDTTVESDETFSINLSGPSGATIADGTGVGTIVNDDATSLSIDDVSVTEGDAATTPATFTVTLSAPSDSAVSVTVATADGTATAGSDYTAIGVVASIAAGQLSTTVTVPVIGDITVEPDENFTVTLSNPAGATIARGTGTGTIIHDDATALSVNDVSVNEGDAGSSSATFTVTLSAPSASPVSVTVTTADGTATAGSDYTAVSVVATIAAGQTSTTVAVPVIGDTTVEPDETFALNLSSPNGATIARGTATGTIVNDDATSLSVSDVSVTEGDSGTTLATFTVSLSAASASPVSVTVATADGTATAGADYTAKSVVATIAAGQLSTTVDVAVAGDTTIEPDETFSVNLSNPTGAAIARGTGTGTILNDDVPTLSVDDVSVTEGNAGTTSATFTLTLSAASASPVSVTVATTNGTATAGSDYTATTVVATIAAGQLSTTVAVPVIGDTAVEANETFSVTLSNPAGATIADGAGVGTIVNDDDPSLSVNDVSVTEGNAGTVSATFTVSLSAASASPVSVTVATADGTATAGSDYTATSVVATIAAGQLSTTVAVPVTGDTVVEPDETFGVVLSAPVGATIARGTGTGTITNDDTALPTLSINDVSITEGNSGTTAATFTITLSAVAASPVSVTVATANGTATAGSDYTATSVVATIAAGQLSTTVAVAVTGDTAVEPNETFNVNLSNPTGATIARGTGTGTIVNDDSAPALPSLSINDVSVTEGNSGTKVATFTVQLSAPGTQPVNVTVSTADGTAKAGSDYVAKTSAKTLAPGQTSFTSSVTINGDVAYEPDETFTYNLSNVSGATIARGTGTGTILNDDAAPPLPSLSVNDVSVTEGNAGITSATFTVSLSAASASPVTVTVATANGTASAGSDYTATSVVATIAAGQLSTTVAVPVAGDTAVEPDETFTVTLSNPAGATIARGTGTATIVNDDAPPLPTLSVNDVSVTEGNAGTTSATFTVSLSATSTSPVSVTVATANGTATAGSDYIATSVVATIPAGQLSTTVAVPVAGDTAVEPDETFTVTLSNPAGATIARGTGTATIVNDDTASVSVDDVSVTEGNAGTTSATFTVSLSAASVSPVSVTVATANGTATAGSDYTATSVVATIAAGQLSTTVAVPVAGDTTVEPDETFSVNLSNPAGATIARGTGVATIVNDDTATLSVDDVSVTEGNAGTTSATFTVSLSAASASPVTVTVATADGTASAGSDYTATSVLATIAAGQLSTTVAVSVSGDTTVEPDETFSVNLSGPSGATIADGTGVATIVNDDTTSLSVDDVSVTEGNAGTTSATFTVSLSAASASPVTVTVATANGTATAGTDYTATSVVATVPAGQLSTTVAVPVSGDTTVEPDETFTVNLSGPSGATIARGTGTATIVNDDAAPLPTLSVNDVSVTEGNAGTTSATFTVSLSAASASPVSVTVATADGTATSGSDYTATSVLATIPAGQLSTTVAVQVSSDTTVEPDETFSVNLSGPSGATIADGTGVATIVNDDAPPLPSLSVNDVSVTEGNAGTTSATFTVTLSAASASPVTVTVATADGTATAGTDYTATSVVATIAAGQLSTTVAVPVSGDTTVEPDETFSVNLAGPTGATIADGTGIATIVNDDAAPLPSLSVNDVAVPEGNAGTTPATFTVSLSAASASPVSVTVATANGTATAGSDYTATSVLATIAAGQLSTTVAVPVSGDTAVEPDETFTVNLSGPTGATIADGTGVATIVNDDAPPLPALSVNDVSVTEGNAGTTSATFTVSLSASSASPVTVTVATADGTATAGTDYTATSVVATIPAGQLSTTVAVPVSGDTAVEPDETFTVNLSSPSGATIADGTGVATILNDDAALPTLVINDVSVTEGNGGTKFATFTVQLSSPSTQPVTITIQTADGSATAGSDYVAKTITKTFAPGVTSFTSSITVNGDTVREANETFTVNLSNPIGATIADGVGIGTILNDD